MAQLEEQIAREFVEGFLGGEAVLEGYRAEIEEARLVEQLQAGYEEFWGIVDPSTRYNTGRLGYDATVDAVLASLKRRKPLT